MYRPDERGGQGAQVRIVRCAIYTRKSTEEGLELAFNSLDAQRDACASYIASQRHEGWLMLPEFYDDGGFSGGNMERPGLKQLMAAVQRREVDVVVVYKVDRLTRSLSDFAKIVDVLDAAKASFVSVTQSFSTVTSMGRLTLNMLLSFAQYERELGSERVRDKIAASKKRGIWMGGVVPLGYVARDRKLVIVEEDAATVRLIFKRYLELGSVTPLEEELARRGICSRGRRGNGESAKANANRPYSRGALYAILQNPIYIGKTKYRDQTYPGEHDPIIDDETFEQTQAMLAEHQTADRHGRNRTDPSPLAGLLFDEHGRSMGPCHATKNAKRYRYYKSASGLGDGSAEPIWRLPAADLENLVTERICMFLSDQAAVYEAVGAEHLDAEDVTVVLSAAKANGEQLTQGAGHTRRKLFRELIERVQVGRHEVSIRVKVAPLLDHARLAQAARRPAPVVLTVAAQLVRVGRAVRLAVHRQNGEGSPIRQPSLIKLVAKAFAAREALFAGAGASLAEVAANCGYEATYFSQLIRLGYLSPEITAAIVEGRQPAAMTRLSLAKVKAPPMDWMRQQEQFKTWWV